MSLGYAVLKRRSVEATTAVVCASEIHLARWFSGQWWSSIVDISLTGNGVSGLDRQVTIRIRPGEIVLRRSLAFQSATIGAGIANGRILRGNRHRWNVVI
jgi:hypothetical protein